MPDPDAADAVFFWNDVLLEALLFDDNQPRGDREQGGVTRASRAAAIVHAAIHDALNGVDRRFAPYLFQDEVEEENASPQAAIAGAAYVTLVALFPSQGNDGANFDGTLEEYLDTLPRRGREEGERFGRRVGRAILRARQDDGGDQPDTEPNYHPFIVKETVGEWENDPLAPEDDQIPPLTPRWGTVRPFGLDYGAQFRPAPYPLLRTGRYANSFEDVRDRGETRGWRGDTATIGLFWSYDDQRGTPVRLYNQNVRDIISQNPVTEPPIDASERIALHVLARAFALVNLAMADAAIGSWDAKFTYNLWRPISGIRRAGEDPNDATQPDADWEPLGRPVGPRDPATGELVPNTTPPFPAYPSGHSSIGTAAFAMMRKVYGRDRLNFELHSDETYPGTADRVPPRRFERFGRLNPPPEANPDEITGVIDENGRSRIFLGVHWNFDDASFGQAVGGRVLGQRVADYIHDVRQLLRGR